jgi:hypothetical protein
MAVGWNSVSGFQYYEAGLLLDEEKALGYTAVDPAALLFGDYQRQMHGDE